VKKQAIWLPPGFDLEQSYTLQALATGTANEHQQKAALKFIVEKLAGAYDQTFDPDNERLSAYNEGRRAVGRAIIQITALNLAKIKESLNPPKETKK
jgi:hypothetical protein